MPSPAVGRALRRALRGARRALVVPPAPAAAPASAPGADVGRPDARLRRALDPEQRPLGGRYGAYPDPPA